MNCLSSQLIITESADLLRNSAVCFSGNNEPQYSSILENNHEKASTLFFDGIISPAIYSLVHRGILPPDDFNYIQLKKDNTLKTNTKCKLIIDFGTEEIHGINEILKTNFNLLSNLSILDIIAGSTSYPLMHITPKPQASTKRYLWKGVDLVNKKITAQTTVTVI